MLKQIDWVFLRRPLIIFLVLTGSSLIFYFGGLQYKNTALEKFDIVKSLLARSHNQLNKQSQELALIDENLKQFNSLTNDAFIGDERRLSWIESMKATNKIIKLPKFDYSIKAQEDFIRPGIKTIKTVQSLSSQMELELGILHEEDIFSVFNLLKSNVKSHFVIESCELSKSSNKDLQTDKENLSARCIIQWVHLKVAQK